MTKKGQNLCSSCQQYWVFTMLIWKCFRTSVRSTFLFYDQRNTNVTAPLQSSDPDSLGSVLNGLSRIATAGSELHGERFANSNRQLPTKSHYRRDTKLCGLYNPEAKKKNEDRQDRVMCRSSAGWPDGKDEWGLIWEKEFKRGRSQCAWMPM